MKPLCLIVGAGVGISFSVAKKFLERDYQVALVSRSEQKLAALASKLTENGNDAVVTIASADAADQESLRACIQMLTEKLGSPSVLIYNAYTLCAGRASNLKQEAFDESLTINVRSALLCAQMVVPDMKAAGRGTIIFTGGGFATSPVANLAALSIGKAGLRALSKCLFDELKPSGVHAGTVTVGGMVKPGSDFDPEKIAEVFIDFHEQKNDQFMAEIVYSGKESGTENSV